MMTGEEKKVYSERFYKNRMENIAGLGPGHGVHDGPLRSGLWTKKKRERISII